MLPEHELLQTTVASKRNPLTLNIFHLFAIHLTIDEFGLIVTLHRLLAFFGIMIGKTHILSELKYFFRALQ